MVLLNFDHSDTHILFYQQGLFLFKVRLQERTCIYTQLNFVFLFIYFYRVEMLIKCQIIGFILISLIPFERIREKYGKLA